MEKNEQRSFYYEEYKQRGAEKKYAYEWFHLISEKRDSFTNSHCIHPLSPK